jgi:hypothetical protein|tara:strand:+ start:3030 stop:3437 length:408 start_codon:yes stop_codon:yes gene_type:complete
MAKNLRNHIVIGTESGTERSVSGSGPSYVISYEPAGPPTALIIGDYVYVEKRAAGAGTGSTLLSTYVYVITAVAYVDVDAGGSSDDITMKYLYDTAGTGDDSPLDLPSGGGSSGSPEQAPHKFVKILGPAFAMFM